LSFKYLCLNHFKRKQSIVNFFLPCNHDLGAWTRSSLRQREIALNLIKSMKNCLPLLAGTLPIISIGPSGARPREGDSLHWAQQGVALATGGPKQLGRNFLPMAFS